MELRGIARDGDDENEIEEELERRRDAAVFVRVPGDGGKPEGDAVDGGHARSMPSARLPRDGAS